MRGILADNDVEGILSALVSIWLSETWRDLWIELNCSLETFPSLDLPRDATDAVVWQACQNQQVVLITGNRNAESPESLLPAPDTFSISSGLSARSSGSTHFRLLPCL